MRILITLDKLELGYKLTHTGTIFRYADLISSHQTAEIET